MGSLTNTTVIIPDRNCRTNTDPLPNSMTVHVYPQRRDLMNDAIKNAEYYTVLCAIKTIFTLLCVKTQQRISKMGFWIVPFETALYPNCVAVSRREKQMYQTCCIGSKVKDIHFRLNTFIENHRNRHDSRKSTVITL